MMSSDRERLHKLRQEQLKDRYSGTPDKLRYNKNLRSKHHRKTSPLSFSDMDGKAKGVILGAGFGLLLMFFLNAWYGDAVSSFSFITIFIGMFIGFACGQAADL